jgi:signal transduction histidine kinase
MADHTPVDDTPAPAATGAPDSAAASIDSIATRLLRIIFGSYFFVTLAVTAVQLTAEYRHTEDRVGREIDAMQQTFGPGIADAMWRYNDDTLRGILSGMKELPVVVGIKVENDSGDIVRAVGEVSDNGGRRLHADATGQLIPVTGQDGLFGKTFSRVFPIVYKNDAGELQKIGDWTVFSNQRIVVKQVEYGFFLILVNSVIKTFALWFIFLYVVRRWLGKPLRQLIDFVGQLNIDNLGENVFVLKDRGRHELHVLAGKLNEMVLKLRTSVAEKVALNAELQSKQFKIQMLNESLELRVCERTADLVKDRQQLAKANADLEKANADLATALSTLNRAHEELGRSERLAALGSLVAGIAHELNTPIGNSLTVASTLAESTREFAAGFATGLKKSTVERFIEDTLQASDLLTRNIVRSANLVTSFKQVAVDQTSAQRRLFDLAAVIDENIKALSPMIGKTAFLVEQALPKGIKLDSYPGPLGQVLMNLVNNAILHGFEGREHGVIAISARLVDGATVELRLSDDGIGIALEHLHRIFDPFFTTKLGTGGCGLGLSISHNIITSVLGGTVKVESNMACGTTFTMLLPLVAPLT